MSIEPSHLRKFSSEISRITDECERAQSAKEVNIRFSNVNWVRMAISSFNRERSPDMRKVYFTVTKMGQGFISIHNPSIKSFRGIVVDHIFHMKEGDTSVIKNEFDDPEFEYKVRAYVSAHGKERGKRYSVRFEDGAAIVFIPAKAMSFHLVESLPKVVSRLNESAFRAEDGAAVLEDINNLHSELMNWHRKHYPSTWEGEII
jgi:hypothetical protein